MLGVGGMVSVYGGWCKVQRGGGGAQIMKQLRIWTLALAGVAQLIERGLRTKGSPV